MFTSKDKVLRTKAKNTYLAITNQNNQKDGSGAQVQRVFSIYIYAKMIRAQFIYSKIEAMEVQHGDPFSSKEDLLNYLDKLNSEIENIVSNHASPSRFNTGSRYSEIKMDSNFISIFFVIPFLRLLAPILRKPMLLTMGDCYKFSNLFPKSFDHLYPSTFNENAIQNSLVKLQIHIRMSTLSKLSDRYVPASFYLDWIGFMDSFCRRNGLKLSIGVHTDCDITNLNLDLINGNVTESTLNYWKNIEILNQCGEFNFEILENYQVFIDALEQAFGNIDFYVGLDPLESWRIMQKSNVLIISKSSFSFVGALLSPGSIVIGPKMSTKGRSNWIICDQLNSSATRRIEKLLAPHQFKRPL
jgi:hypothetical protein